MCRSAHPSRESADRIEVAWKMSCGLFSNRSAPAACFPHLTILVNDSGTGNLFKVSFDALEYPLHSMTFTGQSTSCPRGEAGTDTSSAPHTVARSAIVPCACNGHNKRRFACNEQNARERNGDDATEEALADDGNPCGTNERSRGAPSLRWWWRGNCGSASKANERRGGCGKVGCRA